jgi:hypothetical protein
MDGNGLQVYRVAENKLKTVAETLQTDGWPGWLFDGANALL